MCINTLDHTWRSYPQSLPLNHQRNLEMWRKPHLRPDVRGAQVVGMSAKESHKVLCSCLDSMATPPHPPPPKKKNIDPGLLSTAWCANSKESWGLEGGQHNK